MPEDAPMIMAEGVTMGLPIFVCMAAPLVNGVFLLDNMG
jgi:hypothetical protein